MLWKISSSSRRCVDIVRSSRTALRGKPTTDLLILGFRQTATPLPRDPRLPSVQPRRGSAPCGLHIPFWRPRDRGRGIAVAELLLN